MNHTKFERYDTYIDSGIEWLGEVPAHWGLQRFKDFVSILSGYSPEEVKPDLHGDTAYYKVDDLNSLSKTGHITQSTWRTNYTKCVYRKNILLLPKRGMSILTNKVGITNKDCIFDTNLMGLRLSPKYVDIKFIFYWIINVGLSKLADITTIPQLNNKHIYPICIQLPKRTEQTAIADYLDTKTTQIDRIIDLLNQKAVQYGKLKQSLINETVTRGLDKTVAMKDSRVEWIGKVPAHWEITAVTNITNTVSIKNHPNEELLSVYRDYGVIIKSTREDNYNKAGADLSSYKLVEPGYLVINKMKAWQGSLGISEFRGIVSPAYITCKTNRKIVERDYLHHLLRSRNYINEYNRLSYGVRVAQWDMRYDDFKYVPVLLPPLLEQQAIAVYLDTKTAQIDRIIASISTQIEKLKELRKTLINNVVTGKIKVVKEGQIA